jgi:hypothetical protein
LAIHLRLHRHPLQHYRQARHFQLRQYHLMLREFRTRQELT